MLLVKAIKGVDMVLKNPTGNTEKKHKKKKKSPRNTKMVKQKQHSNGMGELIRLEVADDGAWRPRASTWRPL